MPASPGAAASSIGAEAARPVVERFLIFFPVIIFAGSSWRKISKLQMRSRLPPLRQSAQSRAPACDCGQYLRCTHHSRTWAVLLVAFSTLLPRPRHKPRLRVQAGRGAAPFRSGPISRFLTAQPCDRWRFPETSSLFTMMRRMAGASSSSILRQGARLGACARTPAVLAGDKLREQTGRTQISLIGRAASPIAHRLPARLPRSSSGLGHQPLTLVTGVRVPYGAPNTLRALSAFDRTCGPRRMHMGWIESEARSVTLPGWITGFAAEPSERARALLSRAMSLFVAKQIASLGQKPTFNCH